MNVTFLIGNGFDINLNLNTSYSSFYKYLEEKYPIKDNIQKDAHMIYRIINDINDDKSKPLEEKLWSDFEMGLGLFTNKITINDIDEFNSTRLKLKEDLAEYLIKASDSLSLISNKSDLYQSFVYSMTNFASELTPKDKNTITNRRKVREDIYYNVITFNYTNSFETIMNKIEVGEFKNITSHLVESVKYQDFLGRIIHIHGTYDSRMITGLNDKSQIANPELRDNEDLIHTFIKPQINSDCGELIDQKAIDLIRDTSIFVVFGMSYGATDKIWWQKICDIMLNNSSIYLVLFEINSKCKKIHLENEYSIKNSIKEKSFNGLELNDDQKKKIAPRILITFNSSKMFKFAEPPKLNNEQKPKILSAV